MITAPLLLTACNGGGSNQATSGTSNGNDGTGGSGGATNHAPSADAGTDQTVAKNSAVSLDGSASSDPEDGANLAYAWTQTAGPAVTLNNSTTDHPGFTAPDVLSTAALSFRLVVSDSHGAQSGDEVVVSVDPGAAPAGYLTGFCNAVGGGALCAELDSVTTQLMSACGSFGPQGFCTLFAGNLQALTKACNENGGPAQLCKAGESLLDGVASACRALPGVPPEACAIIGGQLISASEMAAYEQGWTTRALALQRRLGDVLLFHHAEFPSTHNSFNATTNNFPPTISGEDSNQKYSVPDQLSMGIRAIELDVHWWLSTDGTLATAFRAPVVCHGNTDHAGCTTEKPFREYLAELRAWLDAHPDEVIVLYIEEHLDEAVDDTSISFDTTSGVIESILGATSAQDLIYRPAQHGASCDDDAAVTDPHSWINLTRAQIRAANRQVMIFTGSCGVGTAWPAMVHRKKDPHYVETTIKTYDSYAYPDCMTQVEHAYTPEEFATKWTRIYEDSTLLSALLDGVGVPITAGNVSTMVKCGVNMIGLDQVTPDDPRLPAFVWSWDIGQPAVGETRSCAAHTGAGRFTAARCADSLPYACIDAQGAWKIAATPGNWQDGAAACAAISAQFAVPRNGNQNEHLKDAKTAASVPAVWLNYNDVAQEGNWIAAP